MSETDPRRCLPGVNAVLAHPDLLALAESNGRGPVRAVARDVLARMRGETPGTMDDIVRDVEARVRARPGRVINGTGVILNTNLGRAPLAGIAADMARAAAGYCDLEWDAQTGERGSRHSHTEALLTALTGAEDGIAVNTNAGAVLLALAACAADGDAIVSRGQLVEIGGAFRVPDILNASGCRLVEVGTTNRTRIADYASAITERTRVLLRVHPANFTMAGFVEEASLSELAALAGERGLTLIDDLGSGLLTSTELTPGEPDVSTSIATGAHLACFSGDKLLGGPQAGIVVGDKAHVARLRAHPLARALRLDKLRIAALVATLRLYLDPADASRRVPALIALAEDQDARLARADRLAERFGWEVVSTMARVGGGALPGHELPSAAVVVPGPADSSAARLRALVPAVATRIHDGRALIDTAAVPDDEVDQLIGMALKAS